MISLPKSWQTYYHGIMERSHRLIDHNIWQGLDKTTLNIWLKNFTNNEEKFFSACLLDSLIYRPEAQTLSLVYDLLFRVINNKFYFSHPNGKRGLNFPECIQSSYNDPQVRLVAVGQPSVGSPGESSYEILRFMKRYFGVYEKWTIFPNQIEEAIDKGVNTLIFVDDFLGTGNQFCEFCQDIKLSNLPQDTYILYAPLVAHQTGIELIKKKYSFVHVCYTEYLSEKNLFFNNFFSDSINTLSRSKLFYEDMIQKRDLMIGEDIYYGHGGLELSYGFQHGTPDNSIPLLWYNADGWNALFKR